MRAVQLHGQHDFRTITIVVVGRRFVPPVERPSTGVAAQKGRERPRLRIAYAAPRPAGGVAHALHVGVRCRDGRSEKLTVLCRGIELRSGQTSPAKVVED